VLAPVALFLQGLVLHGLRSMRFSPRALEGGDKQLKGVRGDGALPSIFGIDEE
jgi:hypothetical protein